jgi:hypothetical protein
MHIVADNFSQFSSLDTATLDSVNGGVDWGRAVDAGNRSGNAGALVGGGAGTVIGGVAGGVVGAGAGGVGAVPGAIGGAAAGAGIGAGLGGGIGWVGGAARDLWNQARGK